LTSEGAYFIHSPGVLDSLRTSLLVAAVTLVISLAIGTLAGYALERFAFRGEGIFRMTLVTTRTFAIVALAIPMSTTFLQWGIDDTVWAVAMVHAALSIPFVVLVTASVFAGISRELEEAAQTLGCTRLQAFIHVVLPLADPDSPLPRSSRSSRRGTRSSRRLC
jgi:multiple sugar transport system permease protein